MRQVTQRPKLQVAAFSVDKTVPSINAIGTSAFSWGAVLNSTEDNSSGTVTVTTVGVEMARPVTLTLNGATYTANYIIQFRNRDYICRRASRPNLPALHTP